MNDKDEDLSIDRVSEILGVTPVDVVRRIDQGRLRERTVGGHRRIRASDLLAFVADEQDRASALQDFGEQTDVLTGRHGP